jgi:hypothetical protein
MAATEGCPYALQRHVDESVQMDSEANPGAADNAPALRIEMKQEKTS